MRGIRPASLPEGMTAEQWLVEAVPEAWSKEKVSLWFPYRSYKTFRVRAGLNVTGATDPPRNLSWMSDTPARDQKLNGVLGWLMPWLMPCMMTGLIVGSR